MLLFSMFGWWYSRGWSWIAKYMLMTRNKRIVEFFSIGALLKTLFAPFRQDAEDVKNRPLSDKLQVLGGNLISRFFGLTVRLVLILCGLLLVTINSLIGVCIVVLWPLVPFAPTVAFLLVLLRVGLINV